MKLNLVKIFGILGVELNLVKLSPAPLLVDCIFLFQVLQPPSLVNWIWFFLGVEFVAVETVRLFGVFGLVVAFLYLMLESW